MPEILRLQFQLDAKIDITPHIQSKFNIKVY